MTLETTYFLSQIVAAVAVIASLVFLALQIRQSKRALRLNTAALQISAYHQVIQQAVDAALQPNWAKLIVRARTEQASLSDDERVRLGLLVWLVLFPHEIALDLARRDAISQELW